MKKVLCVLIFSAVVGLFALPVNAITRDGFTLTVLHNDQPIREFNGQVAIPFYEEYKLRLKNSNDRRCIAKVWIDGAPVSKLGDPIIDTNGYLDLERFLDRSLTEGKRFKFVPLTDPEVDDPTRTENGIIRVQFVFERAVELYNGIIIIEQIEKPDGWVFQYLDSTMTSTTINCSNGVSPGATVGGGYSDQSFKKVHFDESLETVLVELRLVGINN